MKRLIPLLLAALLLNACSPSPSIPETTLQETTSPPETSSPPETTLPPDPLEPLLEHMTLAQKVGQLFIVAPDQFIPDSAPITAISDILGNTIDRYPVGGFVLFADNIVSPGQLQSLNRALQDASDIPLFLAVDEEGGIVARLARNEAFALPRYQNAAAVGASGNPEDAREMGRTIGGYLAEYGFNLDFAPVADVSTNPDNPVIGTRAFSSDPRIAADMAAAFADGLEEMGVIATFKHFPGHGDTAEDSHSGLAVSYKFPEELDVCEYIPFTRAEPADMIMVGHIALPNVTGNMMPATLSREIVTGILRKKLGFEGLIITDAMDMGAIAESYASGEAAVAALAAGCHIVLMPENLPEAFDAVIAALEEGRLTMEWLDETVRRILEFKVLHGIITF